MRSTFMGLEIAKRGLYAQQSAIYVTGHNIANKNTPGYSRQRVNFEASTPFPAASMNRPQIPGQMGTGVDSQSIQRIRDQFIDHQYRGENNKFGYYESLADSIRKMEEIMNEPSDFGLSMAMDQFWQSLQQLSTNPENEGARRVVLQRGESVAETFQYLHTSLTTVRSDIGRELNATVDGINEMIVDIENINQQISEVEPHGYVPNDLYDERDRLIDELAKLVPIETEKISYVEKNRNPLAEGGKAISIVLADGSKLALINNKNEVSKLENVDLLDIGEGKGKLSALIEAYGNEEVGTGLFPDIMEQLDEYAFTFAQVFNEVHMKGFDMKGEEGKAFFEVLDDHKGAAGKIKVANLLPSEIAASSVADEQGNGNNALQLSDVKDKSISEYTMEIDEETSLTLLIESGTLQSYYEGLIGQMAVKGQHTNRLHYNTEVLLNSIDNQRKSISEVSLDEEFSNLIQFQHAYSASARMITAIDEMIERIINGMGHVGR